MFGKRYKNVVAVFDTSQAMLVSGMEGYAAPDEERMDAIFQMKRTLRITLNKPRRYLEAVLISLKYSRMGIFNCIIPSNETDNFKD